MHYHCATTALNWLFFHYPIKRAWGGQTVPRRATEPRTLNHLVVEYAPGHLPVARSGDTTYVMGPVYQGCEGRVRRPSLHFETGAGCRNRTDVAYAPVYKTGPLPLGAIRHGADYGLEPLGPYLSRVLYHGLAITHLHNFDRGTPTPSTTIRCPCASQQRPVPTTSTLNQSVEIVVIFIIEEVVFIIVEVVIIEVIILVVLVVIVEEFIVLVVVHSIHYSEENMVTLGGIEPTIS